MSEYVKIKVPELSYGEENLLQTQISLLNLLKNYRAYEKLRNEELFLKIDLKKKFEEASEFLDNLNRILPESKFAEEQKHKEKMKKEIAKNVQTPEKKTKKKEKSNLSIDEELEEIRKKLDKLK